MTFKLFSEGLRTPSNDTDEKKSQEEPEVQVPITEPENAPADVVKAKKP